MPSHQIIDLSLSTDDELPPPLPAQAKTTTKISEEDFFDLSDDFDFSLALPPDKPTTESSLLPISTPEPQRSNLGNSLEPDSIDFDQPTPKRRRISKAKDDSDPILFTSSPHALSTRTQLKRCNSCPYPLDDLCGEDDEALDDISEIFGARPALNSHLSSRTAALLSNISINVKGRREKDGSGLKSIIKEGKAPKRMVIDNITESRSGSAVSSSTQPKATEKTSKPKSVRLTSVEREMKELERERVKAQKELEKEAEKERKRLAREEKAREKEVAAVLAEVNKSKTNKKTSTPEMIVDLPASIQGTTVDTQIRQFMKVLDVQTTTKENIIPNIIRWRRKTKSQFNTELGHWEPVAETILPEKHIMCLVSAKEFVALATAPGPDNENLEGHVRKLRNAFNGCIPIYMIEGLDTWSRKVRNLKNRAYQAAVLSQMDNAGGPAATASRSKSKRKHPEEEAIDEDLVEDALLRLQVIQGCLVHQTNASVETAEWVSSFTQHISTIPYKYIPSHPT